MKEVKRMVGSCAVGRPLVKGMERCMECCSWTSVGAHRYPDLVGRKMEKSSQMEMSLSQQTLGIVGNPYHNRKTYRCASLVLMDQDYLVVAALVRKCLDFAAAVAVGSRLGVG